MSFALVPPLAGAVVGAPWLAAGAAVAGAADVAGVDADPLPQAETTAMRDAAATARRAAWNTWTSNG